MLRFLRRSLKLHLSISFAMGTLMLTGSLLVILDRAMVRSTHAQVDKDLRDAANVALHRLEEDHFPLDKELLEVGEHLFLRVADPQGRVLLEPPEMPYLAPLAQFPIPGDDQRFVYQKRPEGIPIKVLTIRTKTGWIQVARDMRGEVLLLDEFRRLLLWAIAVLPVLAFLLAFGLVKLGLLPLRILTRKAAAVRPENLSFRLDTTDVPQELDPLCQELNSTFERLDEGFKRLGALTGDLAHELRTPLHSMRLELDRILEEGALPKDLEDSLGDLQENVTHMAALLEQMILLARVEDPSRHLERQPIDLGSLFELTRTPFVAIAAEKGVHVVLQLAGNPILDGDATLIRRALHNLLSNAMRHSPEGGTIVLSARVQGQETLVEVQDQGPGMPDEVKLNLGQRFLRVGKARDSASGGAGLGLAIIQGIALLHGGSLEFDAVEPNGCIARLRFP